MRHRRDPPGVTLEQGRYATFVAPPEPLLALLCAGQADRGVRALARMADRAVYLYGAASRRGQPARRTLTGGG